MHTVANLAHFAHLMGLTGTILPMHRDVQPLVSADQALSPTDQPVAAAVLAGELPPSQHVLSVCDMFKLGIGPSSSHTVGPMRAGLAFATELAALDHPAHVTVDLFGSLGATGRGHNTDRAVLLGLAGYAPETVAIDAVESMIPTVARSGVLTLMGGRTVPFDMTEDMRFCPRTVLPYHVNGLTLTATRGDSSLVARRTYYSVGGGFVMAQVNDDVDHPQVEALATEGEVRTHTSPSPYPFFTSAELLAQCQRSGLSIADVVRANEAAARSTHEYEAYLDSVANAMFECVDAGVGATGLLPGGLDVPRRAQELAAKLASHARTVLPSGPRSWVATADDPMRAMDWVNLFALAVNEENAAGHRVVTAPTNGAAGVIPAVLGYLVAYCPEAGGGPVGGCALQGEAPMAQFRVSASDMSREGLSRRLAVHDFLLAATAIGALIKTNASIAGAEVGCQGEVGSASAMAAAGLAQALGGSPQQVENAAEIAMEHSLGLTCDPVGGLVQIPCIERNAIAAVKAINAARMALWGDGRHAVTLDVVIETMRQTGVDMLSKYKETSEGGLAVNVVEC